ncbi:helix-turn-helix domain-containing protein [Glutamicibacter arilaitensis]|uniref:helix-turn-helix domain-containing protein n=2 Tax=Micrococcaceae TaxID=1268 RepID=UPI003F8F0D9A
MAGQKIEAGATSRTVAANLSRLRESLKLTYTDVSRRLEAIGYSGISPLAVRRMEESNRRVDADDLMALSIALNVNPNALLLPHYSGDVDVSNDVTAMPEGSTGGDIWAWADGWQALPHHRSNAPEVEETAKGMERGRQEARRRKVTEGWDFLNRVRPQGEVATRREFIAKVREEMESLEPGQWLTLWQHAKADGVPSFPVAEYPRSRSDNFIEHIKAELVGMLRSTNYAHVLDSALKEIKSHGDD